MAKTKNEIIENIRCDISDASDKEIDTIFRKLKEVLYSFDRDSLFKI